MMGRTVVVSMDEVKELVSIETCIRLQEEVFALSSSGRAWDGVSVWADPDAVAMAHPRASKLMLGGIEPDWWGVKTIAFSEGTPDTRRRMAIIALYHAETLLPAAFVEANYLGYMRTGVAGAVGTKHLAREDARVLGVLGCGAVARFAVRAHMALRRETERICLYNPSAGRREAYAAELRETYGLPVETFESADAVASRAEILISATAGGRPAFDPTVLRPGTHVNSLGHRAELDHRIFGIARTIADARDNAVNNGKLSSAIAAGAATADAVAATLGDVVAGVSEGRRDRSEITLLDSSGLTYQDIMVAAYIWHQIDGGRRGVGSMVELGTDGAMW